ncbi:Dual specificity protein phosphatase 10 [Mortierella alpina]|nr:Dual specificity protein phosphatase 10 [Mortierella alpina]
MPQLSLATPPTSYAASSTTSTPVYTATSPLSPPTPMMRPTSQSFSLQRPLLAQDAKKTRNSKRLSLLVPPSPGKLETLASMAAAASPSLQTPSTPSASSFSARRAFASAPISVPLSTLPQSTAAATRKQCHMIPDQPLHASRLSTNTSATSSSSRRPISAYYSDFSAECGVASPYTSEPVCVLPHLYLGAEHNALDVNMLSRLGITSVLNVAVEIATAASEESRSLEPSSGTRGTTTTTIGDSKIVYTSQGTIIHYKNLSWTHHQKNLKDEFPMAFKFIEETRSLGGKVLVHCQLGVSRSASLVIAYVMKTRKLGLSDAYEFVKTRSGVISPNMSLMYQLAEFEKTLKDKPATLMSRAGSKHAHASPEDDEDVYPYPTDRMDIDCEDDVKETMASSRRLSQTILASAAGESQARRPSTSKRATLVLSRPGLDASTADQTTTSAMNTRPRSPHYDSSRAPLSSDSSIMTVPRTPMTDRFSFSSFGPATPPTPTKSFPNKARYEPLQLQQLQENEEYHRSSSPTAGTCTFDKSRLGVVMDCPSTPSALSPPVPPFFPSSSFRRQPESLASSASSFRTSIPSRPSSTSSASSSASFSASVAHCSSDELAPTKDEAVSLIMPAIPTTPSHASSTSNKKAMIHSLATVLTRRFSGRFHGPQASEGSRQGDVHYRASDALEHGSMDDAAEEAADKCGADEFSQENKSPEFVFSPRPCSPPLLEAHTFGEFYQALRM